MSEASGREAYKQSAARLRKAVEEYEEMPNPEENLDPAVAASANAKLLNYLRGVAHNIEYNI